MRARLGVVLALLVPFAFLAVAPVVHAAPFVVAQEDQADPGTDTENSGSEDEAGEGQGDPDAETGAGEGETEGAAEEEGPPWTYQMARLGLLLMAVVALGLWLLYHRLIGQRQKGAA